MKQRMHTRTCSHTANSGRATTWLTVVFGLLLLLSPYSAGAQTAPQAAEGETLYLKLPEGALRSTPGGSQVGSARSGAPLKKLEVRGDWVRVSLEGWVKSADVDLKKGQSTAGGAVTAPSDALTVADFSLETLSKNVTGDVERVRLKLTLKNNTDQLLQSWSGLLVIQDGAGQILVRTTITNGTDAIKPRSTGEASYYWTAEEREFSALQGLSKDAVRISLLQVKLS